MLRQTLFSAAMLFVFAISGRSQSALSDSSLSDHFSVTLHTTAEPRRVPLNRYVTLSIQLQWQDHLDRYTIEEIEEPVLTNLEIAGSGASNRVTGTAGGRESVKEMTYTLKPVSLGMAYVEGVGVTYQDASTGENHHLKTQRIGIEVISPVPEGDSSSGNWIWLSAGLAAAAAGAGIFMLVRKRAAAGAQPGEPTAPPEEKYLRSLKTEVDLKSGDRREMFAVLSRIYRRYLSEKYQIPALEATTADLPRMLADKGLDEGMIRKSEALFHKADIVKFSGQDAARAELDEAYTLVETVLETKLADFRKKQLQAEMEKGRRKKRKLPGQGAPPGSQDTDFQGDRLTQEDR